MLCCSKTLQMKVIGVNVNALTCKGIKNFWLTLSTLKTFA